MVMSTEVASFIEGEWSCYGGGQFKWRERVIMLRRDGQCMEGQRSCYRGGQFNGERIVMEWPV